MSSIDTALYTRLSGFAGLAALGLSTRIYPPPAPQNATYPLVTLTQISGIRDYVMGNQSGLVESRFQLDSWAATSTGVRTLAEQVRLALSNYHGISDSIVINLILMENEEKTYDKEAFLHRIMQEYRVIYWESKP